MINYNSLVVLVLMFAMIPESASAKKTWKKSTAKTAMTKLPACAANANILKSEVWQFNYNKSFSSASNKLLLDIPFPDGSVKRFTLKPSGSMSAELAAKYPGIKSFLGECVDDKNYRARIDFNDLGFHALVSDVSGNIFLVEPFCNKSKTYYSVYNKSDYKTVRPPFNENSGER